MKDCNVGMLMLWLYKVRVYIYIVKPGIKHGEQT